MPRHTSACWTSLRRRTHVRGFAKAWRTLEKGEAGQSKSSSRNSKPSMAYRVEITDRADRDLEALYGQVHAADSERARNWYFGLRTAILGLRDMPGRCSRAPEN